MAKDDLSNNQRIKHWLTGRPITTQRIYRKAFRDYSDFRGLTADELLDEKWADMQKQPKDQGFVEARARIG
jgi:hypothetical protein